MDSDDELEPPVEVIREAVDDGYATRLVIKAPNDGVMTRFETYYEDFEVTAEARLTDPNRIRSLAAELWKVADWIEDEEA